MEKEREERQRGGVLELEEQQRQTGVAMLLCQASAPLPGYLLTQTCLESLELQVSSGLFLEEDTSSYWYIRVVLKKKREVVHEGFTLSRGTQSTP